MDERTLKVGFEQDSKEIQVKLPPGAPPVWDLNAELKVIGTDVERLDALEKVTGRAKYTFDVKLPGMLHGRILRSRYPAAVIKSVDTSAALKMPGVKALVLAFEEAQIGDKPVRYAGEEILAVAAETPEQAEDAIRAVKVEYEPRPFVVDVDEAQKPGAPVVHKGEKSNVHQGKPRGDRSRAEEALGKSAKQVSSEYRTQVQTHSALETHGVVVEPLADGGLRCWASTQGVFSVRDGLAESLNLSKDKVEVIAHYIGGGFGAKFGPRAEGLLCAQLARKAKAPVKLMLNRKEEHLATGNRPNSRQKVKLGADAEGKLTGAVISTYGTPGVANGGAGCAIPIIYMAPDHPALFKEEANVNTNAGPAAAFRAPGHPQGVFAMEQTVDQLAYELGMDPLEFRRRNDPNPIRAEEYVLGAREIGWNERWNKTPGSGPADSPKRRGLGVAATQWFNGGGRGSHADVEIHSNGDVVLMNGAQDIGTGFRTIMAMIVAETLGLKPEQIITRIGESRYGYGPGSGGSTTTPSVAPAVHAAAHNAAQRLAEFVAAHWGISPQDVEFAEGTVRPRARLSAPPKPPEGADGAGEPATGASTTPPSHMKPLTFRQACALMPADKITAGGDRPENFEGYRDGVAGCQFAEVEVDTETGEVRVVKVVAVQDAGRTINEMTCRSQVAGAVIQGVSYALFEDRVMDKQLGHMVNPNFIDYKIAGPVDCPEIVVHIFQVANGKNTVGVLGMSEAPTIPTAAAVANAVYNAIGVRITELPITPDKVLAALSAGKKEQQT